MIRIRVHPQGYGARLGGYGGYGAGGVSATAYYTQALDNERKVSDLRLDYERQLWTEKLKAAQLQAAIQYGGGGGWGGGYRPFPYAVGATYFAPQQSFFGGLGLGGLLGGMF